MSWSHHAPDTCFELAGVDSNNDADVCIALAVDIFGTFSTNDYVVSQNESVSFDETPRLALLSTPPLEEEDERTTHVVLSLGSVVLRWNHSNYWKRRRGELKSTALLYSAYYIFRRHLHLYI
jgi:hypothetical protein